MDESEQITKLLSEIKEQVEENNKLLRKLTGDTKSGNYTGTVTAL